MLGGDLQGTDSKVPNMCDFILVLSRRMEGQFLNQKNGTAYLKLEEKLHAYLLWLQKRRKKDLIALGNSINEGLVVVLLKANSSIAYYHLKLSQIRV